ncbi:hypothetical protein [Halobellus salinisoli]|uniref:hypothetical protein n=1 Tax=Halobellus salinisoli TaxID=3108500 RepID=UPI003008B1B7
MKQDLERLERWMENVENRAQEEENPHRSAILWNYLHHVALEQGGEWEEIFTRELIVDDPHYEVRNGPEETIVIDSAEGVKAFYEEAEELNFFLIADDYHQTFVNEWGLAEFLSVVMYQSGEELRSSGLSDSFYLKDAEIDDPDAIYRMNALYADFWPYDEDAKLIGELVYILEPYDVVKIDDNQIPSQEEVTDICEEYYPENSSGPTPPIVKDSI